MRDQKKALRAELLWRRDSLPAAEIDLWSRLIQERTLSLDLYQASPGVALYSPVGNEVETAGIRDHAIRSGKKVFYPRRSEAGSLELIRIESPTQLRPGAYGILEPISGSPLCEAELEELFVIVPGVAFDLRGNRLGRGKGMYDRLLQQLGNAGASAAAAYESQIVEQIPVQPWDRRVEYIITEKRIIDCANSVCV